MALNYDIQFLGGDLQISNGDFVIDWSDEQHIEDTIKSWPGWWKEWPTEGVMIGAWQNASGDFQALQRKIKIELENDGYVVANPKVTIDVLGKLTVQPNATKN